MTPSAPRLSHVRRAVTVLAAAALTATTASTVTTSSPAAAAPAASPAVPAGTAARLQAAAAAPGSAPADFGTTTLGRDGWQVSSSADTGADGARISQPGFDAQHWLAVHNDDGGAPGTEIAALLQNGACPDVFYSDRMKQCFGEQKGRGHSTVARFAVPWWWRTTFATPPGARHTTLVVNGVIGTADVYVNGTRVATHHTVQGAYTQYRFDVTGLLRPGGNALAVEVHPNNPARMFTLDHVDWGQNPPDNNTGIQFPVQLQTATTLGLTDAHVVQHDAADLSTAALTVSGRVTNTTATAQAGTVSALVVPPGHGTPVFVSQAVRVPAHDTATVSLSPADHPSLVLHHPQVWWPYQLGGQPLYTVVTALDAGGQLVASHTTHVGIRTVTSSLVGPSPLAPGGVRQYVVNGRRIVLRGGGFDPDLFLRYSSADTAHQIALLHSMGLNTLRLEGHFMPDEFYDQMDRAGILVASGYQCCDAWELDPSVPLTQKQRDVLSLSAATLARRLRDHASVFTFQWSDNQPTDEQEALTLAAFRAEDFDVPIIASAEYKSSPQLGLAGEKEGPYDWVPPSYWYDRAHSDYADDSSLTNVGGAWGLDSEQSAGHTIPTRDSLDRFLSPADEARLWQQPKANQYHANPETGTSGYAFGTLYNFDTALRARYGPWSSLDQYVEQAQLQNYENVRSQFEAFIDHSTAKDAPSTGTIYWMANKGWPTLLWALYNDDYDQAGSYFGAQEANRPLHALFATDDHTVTVDNLTGATVGGLDVQARVFSTDGTLLDDRHSAAFALGSQQVRTRVLAPRVPATTAGDRPASTYFVELLLRRDGRVVDRNTYWQSTRRDVVDWSATEGNPQATMTQYADLTGLHDLAPASVRARAHTVRSGGRDRTVVTLTNTGRSPAFFLRTDVRRGTGGDDEIRPATWTGNDTTLWPGESETVTAAYADADRQGSSPVVSLSGWNLTARSVPAA